MHILLVDDDAVLRMTLGFHLEQEGHSIKEAEDGEAAVAACRAEKFDSIILDVNMPKLSGLEALKAIKQLNPSAACLILTAYSNIKDAVTAIKLGAFDYLEKPTTPEQIIQLLNKAVKVKKLVDQATYSAPQLADSPKQKMIGQSDKIKKIFSVIDKVAQVDTSILIRGESGTGKELVAKAIHYFSPRKKRPFIAVNCASFPEDLIESELFGFEKGAFTGAIQKKIGKFKLAEGGTLFLDEVGDISRKMQVTLLRVLQEKAFYPIGSSVEIKCDVRIVAATNQPLEKLVQSGEFREDLFYRLNVIPIKLPPLRERKEDINMLVQYLLKQLSKRYAKETIAISNEALDVLTDHNWPGNIRELENTLERIYILTNSSTIDAEDVLNQLETTARPSKTPFTERKAPLDYHQEKEVFERDFLVKALRHNSGKVNQTAIHTKIAKVTLLRKLQKYALNPGDFK